MRFDERMENIREGGVPSCVRKHLGTTCFNEKEASNRFAVSIANSFRRKQSTKGNTDAGLFSSGYTFDSYISAHVAPDHMFKNLISNVLTVCFNYSSNNERTLWDQQICTEIASHNLPTIDTLLNRDKNGTYKGLNNISTSNLFCALLFSAQIFTIQSERFVDKVHHFHSPQQL